MLTCGILFVDMYVKNELRNYYIPSTVLSIGVCIIKISLLEFHYFLLLHSIILCVKVSVLNCWWPPDGKIVCNTAPGYTFTGTISQTLTISIPRATVNTTGTYSCQSNGYGGGQIITCDFKITIGEEISYLYKNQKLLFSS